MRPALKPGLLPVWRDRDTLQIGIDPRRAVALTGMAGVSRVVSLLDGSRDRDQVLEAACADGIPAETADRVLTLLAAGGALDDFPAGTLRVLPQPLRSRLAAELATVSLARQDGDGGARTLARRQAAYIRIRGTGRIATAIADILVTAGIGIVSSGVEPDWQPAAATGRTGAGRTSTGRTSTGRTSTGRTSTGRTSTGRTRAGRTGASRAEAVCTGADRTDAGHLGAGPAQAGRRPARPAPGAAASPPADGPLPDLAVLVGHPDPELAAALISDQTPHLTASASEAIGVVGPLVLPGRTACLRCLDLHRTDRDPAWPLILAQLAGRQPIPLACDAPLTAAVAAQAAFQALAFIDGATVPDAVANGTLEFVLPAWQWRRRTWPPHQRCSCGSHRYSPARRAADHP